MAKFAELVNAGIDGVKDVSEDIEIMIHSISERSPSDWLSALVSAGVERIDVFGLSYYAQWHGTPDDLEQRVGDVAENHDVYIALAEYSDNHRKVNDIIFNLPDGKGLGTFIWEPTGWGEALFDRSGTNERMDYYPEMVKAYGNDTCTEEDTTPTVSKPAGSAVQREFSNAAAWFDEEGRLHLMAPLQTGPAREARLFTLQGKLAGKVRTGGTTLRTFAPERGIHS
jgi:arabinogalactan endo-1,4-beta-galactosidase